MNTGVMFSSATDLWSTPQEYFDGVSKEFSFTLDVCALPENTKCEKFFSPEIDGLSQDWKGVCWMNPPLRQGHRQVGTEGIRKRESGSCSSRLASCKNRYKMVP